MRHRNLSLDPDDAVFPTGEAVLMRRVLDPSGHEFGGAPQHCSLAQQHALVARLEVTGRFKDALQITACFGLADFGPAGHAVLAAPTLLQVAKSLRTFAPLLNLRHGVRLVRSRPGYVLALQPQGAHPALPGPLLARLDRAKLGRFLADILAHRYGIAAYPCESPGPLDEVLVPSILSRAGLPRSGSNRFRTLEREAQQQLRNLERTRFRNAVRRILGASAINGIPRLATVAADLGYSPRTFRRRLLQHGTSFMECVSEVRRAHAHRYLTTTNLTVETIAERLGYSDTANFRHAFRRWTGVPPRDYAARYRMSATAGFPGRG